ncbi:4'-phosphopantetheinyl transferase family protein [Francisella philomiragia]|uniref:4'-phosphopantetheinyl transferase family protein n=1 Tax=Francisella philomiragia TaxID=28110 RepID=UPI001903E932|nr:4'-phosphopantetheinyl transferase superfamily protein [Francisella philomiragia]
MLKISDNLNQIEQSILPKEQTNDILSYKFKNDRDKRLLARCFLYTYLRCRYGIENFKLSHNSYGKPFLINYKDIDFSISYSEEYILVGISSGYQIGIDIEYVDININHKDLIKSIMHNDEIKCYNQLVMDNEKLNFFFEVFNKKEAIIKSFGMGLYYDVTKINILNLSMSIGEKIFLESITFEEICSNYKSTLVLKGRN